MRTREDKITPVTINDKREQKKKCKIIERQLNRFRNLLFEAMANMVIDSHDEIEDQKKTKKRYKNTIIENYFCCRRYDADDQSH